MKMNFVVCLCFAEFVIFQMDGVIPCCSAAEPVPYNTPANVPAVVGMPVPATSTSAPPSALRLQAALLKDLAQEHTTRAAEAAVSNQLERVKWETALAYELQQRSIRLLKVIDRMNNPQNGSERAQALSEANSTNKANGTTDEELQFLATLDDKLLQLGQEINSAIERTRFNVTQLGTNTQPENIQRIGLLEEENQRYIRELQKQQFDLDLRRLEYLAIRRFLKEIPAGEPSKSANRGESAR